MARTRKRTHSPQTTTDQKSVETARELSVQARATQEGTWGSGGLLTYLTQAGQLIAPWWSPRRDVDLDAFWKKSDHLSGARALLIARVATVPLRVLPRDSTVKAHLRQAEDFTIRLTEESEFGQAWTDTISKWLGDYFSCDNGAFWEIIGEGKKDGPIVGAAQGLACLDSFQCMRTGDIEYPVLFRGIDGGLSKLHRTRVAFASDMPSSRTEMRSVGFCALSRAVNVAQNLQDISIFKQEKLGSRPVRGILLGKGIRTSVVTGSLEVADEIMDNQGLARFARLPIIGDIATDADLSLLSLSGLPDGFDEETSTRLGMFAIALAFGVPIRWIWPAATTGATKADAEYQHYAGLSGGIAKVLAIITTLLGGDPRGSRHSAGKFLPPHLKLVFDFQDDEQDRMRADIQKTRTEAISKSIADGVFNIRIAREKLLTAGNLTQAQFNQLELDDGRLPDGSDVLALFTSTDDVYLRLLDLGVREPLALHANDPFIILEEIDLAALNAQNIISTGRTAGERQKAREALAALGKLKTLYAPEAQRETEQEMQAEVTAEVQEGEEEVETEAEVAEGEKGLAQGFNFSVPMGEIITGELARGAGGKFVNVAQLKEQLRAGILARRAAAGEAAESKPSAAASAKTANCAAVAEALGLPPGSLDSLTALRSGGDAGDVSDLVGRGFVKLGSDGQPIMTTLGRSMLSAGNSGDVDKARAAIDKDAEKKTSAQRKEQKRQAGQASREAKKKEREAERERKRQEQERQRKAEAEAREAEQARELADDHAAAAQALGARGVKEGDFNSLIAFREGAGLQPAMAQRLAASGLVELDPEGNPRLTQDGRAMMSAADKGDIRKALDEMSRARERVLNTLDKAEATREKASDARDKAADYRADAEKLDEDADTYEAKADGYEAGADGFDAEADGIDAEVAALVAAGADSEDIEKAEAKATKARERAEKKREQAESKREQASKKLERAADKRKSATEKDEDATGYDDDAGQLVDKVGGGAAVELVTRERMGPGSEAPEPRPGIVRDPYSRYRVSPTGTVPEGGEGGAIEREGEGPTGEGETIEHGLSGRVKAMVQGALGPLLDWTKGWRTFGGRHILVRAGGGTSSGGRAGHSYDLRNGVTLFVETGSKVSAADLSRLVSGLPMKGRQGDTIIEAVVGANPKDAIWAEKYGMPGFKSFAIGGVVNDEAMITYFNTEGRAWSGRVPKQAFSNVAHEFGHVHAKRTWGSYDPPKAFRAAMKRDRESWSDYAKNSISEDFAESYKAFFTAPEWFRLKCPARHEWFEAEFAD